MGNQYHLSVGGEDFYIDLLFYNVRLHCYLVVELKNEKFRPEFTGKLGFYVAVVDDMLTNEFDNPTIGLVLCKEKNDVVAEYALRSIDQPVGGGKLLLLGRRTARGLPGRTAFSGGLAAEDLIWIDQQK